MASGRSSRAFDCCGAARPRSTSRVPIVSRSVGARPESQDLMRTTHLVPRQRGSEGVNHDCTRGREQRTAQRQSRGRSDKSAQAGRERNVAARSTSTQPGAFAAVRREQRDEQLFWLTLLESIRHTVEGGRVEESTQRYPAVLRRRRCSIECVLWRFRTVETQCWETRRDLSCAFINSDLLAR
jgi:hypothetical protein